MRYSEGARRFYRALAERLLVEPGTHGSIQLVAPENSSPPEEDCIALARALAARDQDSVTDPCMADGATVDPAALPRTPLVLDCRDLEVTSVTRFRSNLEGRADVVVLVRTGVALLGCRRVNFGWDNRDVFFAATDAFKALVDQLGFRAQALEMPARFLKQGLRGVQDQFTLFEPQNNQTVLTSEEIERFCNTICRTWTYRDKSVSGVAVYDWARQFERLGALREALSLLDHLNRDGFVPKGDIVNHLLRLYADLSKELDTAPQPVSIQHVGKSEPMLFYDLREITPCPPSLFDEIAKPEAADHLVCFDDVIGSGKTILDCLFPTPGSVCVDDLRKWLAEKERRITVLAAIASEQGVSAIERDPRCQGKVKIRAGRILTQGDSVFSPTRNVFENAERRDAFRAICSDIGKQLFCWGPLGWDDCQWCVVTDYNVPDCSLPMLWAQGTEQFSWTPLFPRR